jgi:hypothetical protein
MTGGSIGDNVKCLATNCEYSKRCFRKQGIDADDIEQSYSHLEYYCNNETDFQDYMLTL